MRERIEQLYDKDDKKAFDNLVELENITESSDELYKYFNELLKMLYNEKSNIRVRGFRLIAALAKWDKEYKIDHNLDTILEVFDDDKAFVIRQCLSKTDLIIEAKPNLRIKIADKINSMDLSKYSDSMRNLISKDLEKVNKERVANISFNL